MAGDQTYRMELSNGALVHPTTRRGPADLVVTLTGRQLLALVDGAGTDGVELDGDHGALKTILDLTDTPDHGFHIMSP